jgi:hypothetical protein
LKLKLLEWFLRLWAACPYAMLGKKTLRSVRKKQTSSPLANDRVQYLKGQVHIGWAIVLVGFFCPFFWIALFSGAIEHTIYLNAVHSGLVILFGIGYLARSRIALARELRKGKDLFDMPIQ